VSTERWKNIPGHRGYQASSLGRVRSVLRVLRDGRTAGGVILTPTPDKDGYLRVSLGPKRVPVHTAVLLAFQGPPEARHLNDDHLDNTPGNLCWGSHLENERDKRNRKERGAEEDREVEEVTGMGSRPQEIASEVVTPVTWLVTLSEAAGQGVVSCSLQALRIARHRGNGFPEAAGQRGVALLYDPQALMEWDAGRRGRAY
jgi:NUMOD4 motif